MGAAYCCFVLHPWPVYIAAFVLHPWTVTTVYITALCSSSIQPLIVHTSEKEQNRIVQPFVLSMY